MDISKLTIFELQALVDFLRENINYKTLPPYGHDEDFYKFLCMAYIKLERQLENWK